MGTPPATSCTSTIRATPARYALTAGIFTRNKSAPITYGSIETLRLEGGSGDDRYDIESTMQGTSVKSSPPATAPPSRGRSTAAGAATP
jgi:hypothetical protein